MMTKKTMTILSVFMIVALTAVGFAAWLIVGTIDAETQGSFVSNELEDKYFKVEVDFDAGFENGTDEQKATKGDIIFGRPSGTYTGNNAWLSYSNKDAKEKLSVTATVKFIPDAGFSKKAGEEERDMEYFLKQVTENPDGSVNKTEYRTVRVVIDIVEALTSAGELDPMSDNYKWFDWAVQLGYINYPTAFVIQKDANGQPVTIGGAAQSIENVDAKYKLNWCESNSAREAEEALVDLTGNEYTKFQYGVLAIDIPAEMFFVDYGSIDTAKEATAEIQIDFSWGTALTQRVDDKDTYLNPYAFFNLEGHEPEKTLTIKHYIEESVVDGETKYFLKETILDNDPDTDKDERDQGLETDSIIRYKDLAQRMLDYLRDHLNYDETNQTGIQFSITLLEGVAISE